jgi:hypothetical protein
MSIDFGMREVERHLTAELQAAREQQRLSEIRIGDRETNTGQPNRDQDLSVTELRSRHLEATLARNVALRRFVDFASHGIIPKDLMSNDSSRSASAGQTSQ